MLKYIINFLIKICLINIFTIKIFPQNCCDICFENCKKILHKKRKKIVKKYNINNSLDRKNSKLKSNKEKALEQDGNSVPENTINNNSHSNNIPKSSHNSGSGKNNRSSYSSVPFDNNTSLENEQEHYLNLLLDNFDNNIKKFGDSIFSENSDFTNVKYTIVKEGTQKNDGVLGEGAFGKVYKVKNKENKIFALKKAFIPTDEESLAKKEITCLIKCRDCENVIKIKDVYKDYSESYNSQDQQGFYYYIVTEWYQKGNLYDYIEQCKNSATTLKNTKVTRTKMKYIYQMINAVKQIHDKGIIHRDIKPENFFISENDNLYLGDFGCATEEYDKKEVCGTLLYIYDLLNYMIYHLYMNNKSEESISLFKHCDLYSLMCVIFELKQHIPFQNKLENSIFSDLQQGNNTILNLLCPNINFDVPKNVCDIIQNKYKRDLENVKNGQNTIEDIWFWFSPLKKWENYKSNENREGNEKCDNMLKTIIQNLFNTKFNIDSIMQTQYYKALKNLHENKN